MRSITFLQYLIERERLKGSISAELRRLIEVVSRAGKAISSAIGKGEPAGILGTAVDGTGRIREVQTTSLHPRVAERRGSRNEVARATAHHAA